MARFPNGPLNNSGYQNNAIRLGYGPDRNIFGRAAKLFIAPYTSLNTGAVLMESQWLANATSLDAVLSSEKEDIKMAGSYLTHYKPVGFTGSGSLTIDKINSDMERYFFEHLTKSLTLASPVEPPLFQIRVSLEDKENFNIKFDDSGFAESGHEEIILENCQFWNIPLGYSLTDMVSQDLEFTFIGAGFGSDSTGKEASLNINWDRIRLC